MVIKQLTFTEEGYFPYGGCSRCSYSGFLKIEYNYMREYFPERPKYIMYCPRCKESLYDNKLRPPTKSRFEEHMRKLDEMNRADHISTSRNKTYYTINSNNFKIHKHELWDLIKERDEYKCVECGAQEYKRPENFLELSTEEKNKIREFEYETRPTKLEIHHVVARWELGHYRNRPYNLESLCNKCHPGGRTIRR